MTTERDRTVLCTVRAAGRTMAGAAVLALAAAALVLVALPAAAQSVQLPEVADGGLAAQAAASYRSAARYPDHSRAVEPGAPDPVRAKRVPAPHSLPGRGEGAPVITVWSDEVSFEHPAPVILHATLDRPAAGRGAGQGRKVTGAAVTGEVVDSAGAAVGTVIYRDDGEAPDRRAGDGVYSARFTFPPGFEPKLAESFGVKVTAVTGEGEIAGVIGGFLYSDPHAHLTGAVRDSVRDGSLVIEAEVVVEEAGRFHLAGTVASMKGEPLGWAQAAAELEPGTHWLALEFYGLMFRERGVAGPYRVPSLALSTTGGMPNALNDLVEDAHRTRAYPLARFTAEPFGAPGLLRAAERLERGGRGAGSAP